jgi:hypothetical protein
MLLTPGTISAAFQIGKFVGHSFMNLNTARGDLKMYQGDHLVEFPYTRRVRPGEAGYLVGAPESSQAKVEKVLRFIVPEDAAKALGIYLKESVEDTVERQQKEAIVAAQVAKEVAEKKEADEAAIAAALAAAELEAKAAEAAKLAEAEALKAAEAAKLTPPPTITK